MAFRLFAALTMTLGLGAASTAAPALHVAAASDLRQALPVLAARYERSSGVRIEASFGSSGKLFAQVEHGAPFDAYFSANAEYPRRLEARGLTVAGSRIPYAVGRLMLWAPAASVLPVERGLAVLVDPRVKKVAIASPAHAPYGQAAVEAMRHAKVYDRAAGKLVMGENISQAAHFAASGSAQVGVLAQSLLATPALKGGRHWPVPARWHRPLVQEAVVLKRSGRAAETAGFLRFVGSPEGRKILREFGFEAPVHRPPPSR